MVGAANDLNINTTGFQTFNQTNGVFNGRTLTAGSSIVITNGNGQAGNPIIASPAFDSVNIQVFNIAGSFTYVPTNGMVWVKVEIVGGGGGGGGAAVANIEAACGSGGGAGAYAVGWLTNAQIGINQPVTVGAAGTAGNTSGSNGGTGGTSSFGSFISCTGGVGGLGQTTGTFSGLLIGGVGGTASGSGISFSAPGQQGGIGLWYDSTILLSYGGTGGSGVYSVGGTQVGASTATAAAGNNGSQGGGGSGPYIMGQNVGRAGGAGGVGLCIVTEYLAI